MDAEPNLSDDSLLDRLIAVYEKRYASQLGTVPTERCPVCGKIYQVRVGLAYHAQVVHGLQDVSGFRIDPKRKKFNERVHQDKEYVLAVDPGKTSGVALLRKNDQTLGGEPSLVWSDELEWPQVGTRIEATLTSLYGKVDVVVERFTINKSTVAKTQAPWSLEIIGVIRWLAWKSNAGEIHLQEPGSTLRFVTNERIKALGMWHKGGAGHAMDAIRHAVFYLVTQEGWRPKILRPDNPRGVRRVDWTRELE